MYPFIRMAWQMSRARRAARLPIDGVHVSRHLCWPWDVDMWLELNNGRTLTLYDLGRLPLAERTGLVALLRRRRWGMTVAGVSVRYRRRVRPLQKVEIRSRALGWDERFLYVEQSMWRADGVCANHILLRMAFTSRDGIVPPDTAVDALGGTDRPMHLPGWVTAWIEAEATRPWPPDREP